MYGDTAAMRRYALQLRDQASDIRALADRLVGQIETITWQGRAAADLRSRIHDRASHLRDCASQHESASESLTRHLNEVDRLKDSIENIERRADSLVADARGRVAGLEAAAEASETPTGVTVEPTDTDRILTRFVPPAKGHKDWLTVELPGL